MKKRIISSCISVLCAAVCCFSSFNYKYNTSAEYQTMSLKGDISGNGKIDIYDAIEIAKSLIGLRTFSFTERVTADYNKDGIVNLYDAIEIAKYLIKNNKPTQTTTSSSSYITTITNLVNKERAKKNLPQVKINNTLSNAAAVRAKEISNLFSHDRPNGKDCFTVLAEFGLDYSYVAENIAAGNPTPEDTMTQWINSPGHYNNLMSPNVTEIGVGYYYAPNSTFKYYWVQLFRNP